MIAGDQKAVAARQQRRMDAGPLKPGVFQQFPQRQQTVAIQLHPQQGA